MVVNVLVELSSKNIDKTFDYIVPSYLEDKIKIGKRVTVPFGHQTLEGFVLGTNDTEYDNLKVEQTETVLTAVYIQQWSKEEVINQTYKFAKINGSWLLTDFYIYK